MLPRGIRFRLCDPDAESGFIEQHRRKGRSKVGRKNFGAALCFPRVCSRPSHQEIRATTAFPRKAGIRLVVGGKVVVDLDVDLCSVGIQVFTGLQCGGVAEAAAVRIAFPQPPDTSCIQAIAGSKEVGLRHDSKELPDETRRIHHGAQGIPRGRSPIGIDRSTRNASKHAVRCGERTAIGLRRSKDTHASQIASIASAGGALRAERNSRDSRMIDRCDDVRGGAAICRQCLVGMAVVPTFPIAEDALARGVGQNDSSLKVALVMEVAIVEGKEKRLVADDRPTIADRDLILILPIGLSGLPTGDSIDGNRVVVVVPGVRVQRSVADIPHCGARVSIGSRLCRDLDLAVATSELRINGGKDEPYFSNQIGIYGRTREDAILITAVGHAEAIPNGIDRVGAHACERFIAESIRSNSRHDAHQVEHIAAHQRKIRDSLRIENLANTCTGSRQHRRRIHRDFDVGRHSGNLQREVEPLGFVGTQFNIAKSLSLETGQGRGKPVNPGEKRRDVVRPRLVADCVRLNSSGGIDSCHRHTRDQSFRSIFDASGKSSGATLGMRIYTDSQNEQQD